MLSAIISDTLLFKSPTCTGKDISTAKELAEIAGVKDIREYGMEMLMAGTSFAKAEMKSIINQDKKVFAINEREIAIAQINTVSIEDIEKREAEIKKEIEHEIGKYGYSLFLFVVTDIINSNSLAFVYGDNLELIEEAFQKEIKDNKLMLENVVSRKKQIIPYIMASAQNM